MTLTIKWACGVTNYTGYSERLIQAAVDEAVYDISPTTTPAEVAEFVARHYAEHHTIDIGEARERMSHFSFEVVDAGEEVDERLRLARILAEITTRDEAGVHFMSRYSERDITALEEAGLITVDRPVHHTGTPYSCEYWTVEVTEDGARVVDTEIGL